MGRARRSSISMDEARTLSAKADNRPAGPESPISNRSGQYRAGARFPGKSCYAWSCWKHL